MGPLSFPAWQRARGLDAAARRTETAYVRSVDLSLLAAQVRRAAAAMGLLAAAFARVAAALAEAHRAR